MSIREILIGASGARSKTVELQLPKVRLKPCPLRLIIRMTQTIRKSTTFTGIARLGDAFQFPTEDPERMVLPYARNVQPCPSSKDGRSFGKASPFTW